MATPTPGFEYGFPYRVPRTPYSVVIQRYTQDKSLRITAQWRDLNTSEEMMVTNVVQPDLLFPATTKEKAVELALERLHEQVQAYTGSEPVQLRVREVDVPTIPLRLERLSRLRDALRGLLTAADPVWESTEVEESRVWRMALRRAREALQDDDDFTHRVFVYNGMKEDKST